MHGQILVNEAGEGHGVKTFHDELVDFLVVLLKDFGSEGEMLSHVSTLVVSS